MHAQKANYQCIFSFVKIMLQYSCKKRAWFGPVFWLNQRHVCLSACLSVNLPVCLSVWLYLYSHSYSVNISDFFLSLSSPSPVWALLGIVGHCWAYSTLRSTVQALCTVFPFLPGSWLVVGLRTVDQWELEDEILVSHPIAHVLIELFYFLCKKGKICNESLLAKNLA